MVKLWWNWICGLLAVPACQSVEVKANVMCPCSRCCRAATRITRCGRAIAASISYWSRNWPPSAAASSSAPNGAASSRPATRPSRTWTCTTTCTWHLRATAKSSSPFTSCCCSYWTTKRAMQPPPTSPANRRSLLPACNNGTRSVFHCISLSPLRNLCMPSTQSSSGGLSRRCT